jgi:drug/metabolite transporter (DMT)-like permease
VSALSSKNRVGSGAGATEINVMARLGPLALLCLLAVYVIWGSTYFAMRVALEGVPPMGMAATRFIVAGLLLYGFARARGAPRPTLAEWKGAAISGVLLLSCGNGAVAFAEQSVTSSLAALVVASVPLWAAVFGRVWGDKPTRAEVVGLAVGFSGVIVLNTGGALGGQPLAIVAILAAPIAWALGSVWSKHLVLPKGAMAGAAQMLVGGVVLAAFGAVRGERFTALPGLRPLLAVAYLIVCGSLLAFSAYTWLLRHVPPSTATSYAYVNPIVAIAIGVAFGGESFSGRAAVATALTLAGVFLLLRARSRRAARRSP